MSLLRKLQLQVRDPEIGLHLGNVDSTLNRKGLIRQRYSHYTLSREKQSLLAHEVSVYGSQRNRCSGYPPPAVLALLSIV